MLLLHENSHEDSEYCYIERFSFEYCILVHILWFINERACEYPIFWSLLHGQSNEFYTCILHLNFTHEFYTWILHLNFTHEFYTWILQLNFTSGCKILIWLHQNFTSEFYTWILHMNFTQKFNSLLLHPFTFAWSNSWGFSIFYIEIFHQQLDFTWSISWEFWIFLYRKLFMTNWISVYTVWTKCRILMSPPYTVCRKI